jgi:Flp pilus assembly CpaF family ATPase
MHQDAPREIESLIGKAVDIIVHIARTECGGRIVREVIEVESFDRVKQTYNTKKR